MNAKATASQKNTTDISLVQEKFRQLLRVRSEEAIAKFSGLQDYKIEDVGNPDDFLYGYWMVLNMLTGIGVRVILKVHFDAHAGRSLLSKKSKKQFSDVGERVGVDHIRETANIFAGFVKTSLMNAEIITSISIPLITSGFDELVFSDNPDPRQMRDVWKISWNEGEVVCSAMSDILNWNDLVFLQLDSKISAPEEDEEFL